MTKSPPDFVSTGKATSDIEVRLSYKIVELFSEGLYASPNKAIEELVANAFDAGAQRVHVLLSSNLHVQNATIAVFDDGEGMDKEGLKRHWLIGISNKRSLSQLPHGRQQIGKFGIGKLATYVLAERLTHISKCKQKYYSTSMDYSALGERVNGGVEPEEPIKIALRVLTSTQAKKAVEQWTETKAFKATGMKLFGNGSPESWTISVMSSLKPKVHEIKPGVLKWVLRTALPLRPDFSIWLNEEKLVSSKERKGLLKSWVLGRDITDLPKPCQKGVVPQEDKSVDVSSEHRFRLDVPVLGYITGYAETYKDLLTGKSDEIGRSYGFFVYVRGRLLNIEDGHFGISPNRLRHGTFGRFRLVVHMNGLDKGLRSNRETIGEGPLLETARNVLQAIFNAVRPDIEAHDRDEEPGAKLSRKLAASPIDLSRWPIVDLSRSVAEGKATSRYLLVPEHESEEARETFLASLEERAKEADHFVTGTSVDFGGSLSDGIVKFDTASGEMRLNGLHPFIAEFHEDFVSRSSGQPLELIAMAEVLAEAQLYDADVGPQKIDEFLENRDQLLRYLASNSGRQSAQSVANALSNARNNPGDFEKCVCDAFRSLGFETTHIGKSGKPDGIAEAHLSADDAGNSRSYKISLEAKSKLTPKAKVSAKNVGIAGIARHRDKFECDHAVIVGPAFPTLDGRGSALGEEIENDRKKSKAEGKDRTITIITIDALVDLVRCAPVKRVGLDKIRELFKECGLPEESAVWVESLRDISVKEFPFPEIIRTIEMLQKEFKKAMVNFSSLRVKLTHLNPPLKYETDNEIADLCKTMATISPEAISVSSKSVEIHQSAKNVITAITQAMRDHQ